MPFLQQPAAVADAFLGHQDALGIHPVEDVAEAPALLADQVLRRHLQIVEEHLGRVVVDHRLDRPDLDPLPRLSLQIDEEHREPVGAALDLVDRGGARQEQHQVGMAGARGPHLLAVDDGNGRCRARTARVLSLVVSEPVVGSVTPNACRRNSPEAIFGR